MAGLTNTASDSKTLRVAIRAITEGKLDLGM
jgi:hypothetical protein